MKNLKSFILIILLAAATSAHAEIINKVYAIVGEKIITQYELETLNPKRMQMIYSRFSGEERQEQLTQYYVGALDLMIDNYVIEQAAAKEGVRVTAKELDAAVAEIMKNNNVDEAKMEEMLAASNITLEQYKWKIKIDILKARLMSTVFNPKIIITDKDIEEYAAKNAAELELSDMYELRIMAVDSKTKLDEALAELDGGAEFRDVAMKFSTLGNAENGGYLGWVEIAFLDDKIRDLVKGIKKGATKPMEEDGVFKVFYVEGFKNKEEVPEEKKYKIIETLQKEQSAGIFERWMADKKKEMLIQRKYAD